MPGTDHIKSLLLLLGGIAAFVLVPYLFWQQVWFGTPLSDDQLDQYLSQGRPRQIQHALEQIVRRIEAGDESVRRWFPAVVGQASSPHPEVRIAAAWAMGHETDSPAFHEALRELASDGEAMVRRNAALALAAFADPLALGELRAMLQPHVVTSPGPGTLRLLVEERQSVRRGTPLARLSGGAEVRSPLSGTVASLRAEEGDAAEEGRAIVVLSPDPAHVWEALRALLLVGTPAERPLVESVLADPSYQEVIKQQAVMTLRAIERRGED